MTRRQWTCATLAVAALFGLGGLGAARAADHHDPYDRILPGAASDIADLYVWHDAGTISAILTFAGPVAPGVDPAYSRDALYALHIDGDDADVDPDTTIYFRFARNGAGRWGVQAENLPGTTEALQGPVGETLAEGATRIHTGTFDDPFFFDLQGLESTLQTGSLRFDGTRDGFAGQNANAIVVEFPESALGLTGPYNVWATTSMLWSAP